MSPTWNYPSRWPTACSTVLLMLASQAIAVYGEFITVSVGDKIQEALNDVQPGDTIEIEEGEYYEDIHTTVSGTADQRITIRAAGGSDNKENVVLRGAGDDRVFQVHHDYYTIESFTIDGYNLDAEDDDDYTNTYRDKLIYVEGGDEVTTRDGGYRSAIDGLVVRDMVIKNAGGECVRLRYFVTYAEMYDNEITRCGIYDFEFNDGEDGKNGEGIYIGTSSTQWGLNPTDDPDKCMGNIVRDNVIITEGNEGVEVKEGSIGNFIEDNEIHMQLDANSGGIGSRGDGTIIRNNLIKNASGAGVRVGGHEVEGRQYGVNNEIYGNMMVDCLAYGVKIEASPQGQICGNDIDVPGDVDDDKYAFSGGNYGDEYNPTDACDSAPRPSSTTSAEPTPAPTESSDSEDSESSDSQGSESSDSEDSESSDSADYEYVGCFANTVGSAAVTFKYQDSDGMSNQDCVESCTDSGARYAGTSSGDRCGCAHTTSRISRNGKSTECVVPCSGDDSEICGGFGTVSIWKV